MPELSEDLDRAIDRSLDHLAEAFAESLDQLDLVGMVRKELLGCFGKAPSGVLLLVPLRRADVGKEMFHRHIVAGEELAIEKSGVPFEEHAAKIENGDAPRAHRVHQSAAASAVTGTAARRRLAADHCCNRSK